MAFNKMSLSGAAKKAQQLGSRANVADDAKARDEKNALDKLMADKEKDQGGKANILGGSDEEDEDDRAAAAVPQNASRHFVPRSKSAKSGPGTLSNDHDLASFRQARLASLPLQSTGGGGLQGSKTASQSSHDANLYKSIVAKASNLPPDFETWQTKDLFKDYPALKVETVRQFIKPKIQGPISRAEASRTFKVTFGKGATAQDLNKAIVELNDKKYLGRGYYLHLDRYLGDDRDTNTKQEPRPFGAVWVPADESKGIAPPPGLGGHSKGKEAQRGGRYLVVVTRPTDPAMLKLVHMTLEGIIEGGAEFEAMLMNTPRVEKDERYAFLYDSAHPVARYYRWRYWCFLTGTNPKGEVEIFEGEDLWKGPDDDLPDEWATEVGDLAGSKEQSDSNEGEDQSVRNGVSAADDYPNRVDVPNGVLTPRSRTMLIWMLANVPIVDVKRVHFAPISTFAIDHALKGLEDIVDLLINNLFQPFAIGWANPNFVRERDWTPHKEAEHNVNALRAISDVAMSSYRHGGPCYKYRALLGNDMIDRGVFAYLEQTPWRLNLGRSSTDRFVTNVNKVLNAWKVLGTFEEDMYECMEGMFNGPTRERERLVAEAKRDKMNEERRKTKAKNVTQQKSDKAMPVTDGAMNEKKKDEVGEIGEEAGTVNAVNALELSSDSNQGAGAEVEAVAQEPSVPKTDVETGESAAARARRLRPKAEDMFASDEE